MEAFVLLFRGANPNTKLAEDVDSSPYFEDGTAAAVFGGNFGARKEEPAAAAAAAAADDDTTLLFKAPSSGNRGNGTKEGGKREGGKREGGKREGGPRRKGNFGECGPAAVNRHEPIIRAGRGECECGAIGRRGIPAQRYR